MRTVLLAITGLVACVSSCLSGCAAKGTGEFAVTPEAYDRAFAAAKQTLREYRFSIERVDAAAGVLTTASKPSAGWATPWDTEQSSSDQESSDLFNRQKRTVRVTFEPGTDPSGSRTGRVEVCVYRVQSPGVRLNPRSVQLTTVTTDPALSAQGVWSEYEVAVTRDPALEARLARRIEQVLAGTR